MIQDTLALEDGPVALEDTPAPDGTLALEDAPVQEGTPAQDDPWALEDAPMEENPWALEDAEDTAAQEGQGSPPEGAVVTVTQDAPAAEAVPGALDADEAADGEPGESKGKGKGKGKGKEKGKGKGKEKEQDETPAPPGVCAFFFRNGTCRCPGFLK